MILLSRVIDQHCSASALISINIDARNIGQHLSEYDIADQLFPPPHRGVVLQLCVSHQDDIAGEVEISEDYDTIAVENLWESFRSSHLSGIPRSRQDSKSSRFLVWPVSLPAMCCHKIWSLIQLEIKENSRPGDIQSRNTSHLLTKPNMVGPKNMTWVLEKDEEDSVLLDCSKNQSPTSSSGWLVMIKTLFAPCSSFTLW